MTPRRLGTGARPVLALHCSLAHGGAWVALAAHLPGATLIAPDLPGHGNAPDWDGRSDLHTLATRETLALLRQTGPLDVIGHSFGATVALRAALEDPDLIRSLTLIEPVLFCAARAAGWPGWAGYMADLAPFAAHMAAGDPEAAARHFQSIWGAGVPWEKTPARQRAYITARIPLIPAQNPTLMDDAAGLLAPWRLESLGLPTLLIEGANSPPVI
ncbi:MAG TPA: alpha/beta fold hydrolase, partial [Paracoccaceae bacterium]|nr:alpha/beta fold hydrolase [Paracoccaceae bacterium]